MIFQINIKLKNTLLSALTLVENVKHKFNQATANRVVMRVGRVLAQVLPDLLEPGRALMAESIQRVLQTATTDALCGPLHKVAEPLTGYPLLLD